MDGVNDVRGVEDASFGAGLDVSTFSPISSVSSSSSAYCERLSSAFDGLSGAGLATASIFLLRRSACGSRAGEIDGVVDGVGFDIADDGNRGPMNG